MPKEKDIEIEEQEVPKKKNSEKGLFIVVILLLLTLIIVGVFAVWLIVFKKTSADNAPQTYTDFLDHGGVTAQPSAHGPKEEPGPIVAYPPFLLNLADPGGSRYLKISLSLELSKEKNFPAEVGTKEPRIKDIIINILASKTYEEISTQQGKIALKQEMMRRLNTVMSGGRITDIYITEFIVQ